MNDETKAAVEVFRGMLAAFSGGYLRVASRSCGGYNAHAYVDGVCKDCGYDEKLIFGEMILGEANTLLAHIDGEPARLAAALKKAGALS